MSKQLLVCITLGMLISYAANCQQSTISKEITGSQLSRSVEGDTVWILLNHVKASQRQQFEHFMHDIFWDSASRLSPEDQILFRKTRVLHPVSPEKDGSYTYVFIMDPVVGGADYGILNLLTKMYGADKAKKLSEEFDRTQTAPQTGFTLIQSRH